ncbi:MAG: hypothetical protein A2494_03460 [Candidatus Lloydbacteria bacterium RIFOXYC12_FULL_46_25]|uniref:Uncharacterized protein n=1 Tax=Candidatus Lloydbacteria bacterium RIFOXYC12_FULL_46_25 TaxID=1798670 RepID=A0A1G2DUT3_9BACT|nr:MAG: hypothetical protein A2494_03460 [Candidatus Lloydbacteria bacterium RIFOXYC12_FULL_46_25]
MRAIIIVMIVSLAQCEVFVNDGIGLYAETYYRCATAEESLIFSGFTSLHLSLSIDYRGIITEKLPHIDARKGFLQ